MTHLCTLITRPPHSEEDTQHMFGPIHAAQDKGMEVSMFLLGDGVLCGKKGLKGPVGENMVNALSSNVSIKASKKDLQARAIANEQVTQGIEIVDDLEGDFVETTMEKADRVISW